MTKDQAFETDQRTMRMLINSASKATRHLVFAQKEIVLSLTPTTHFLFSHPSVMGAIQDLLGRDIPISILLSPAVIGVTTERGVKSGILDLAEQNPNLNLYRRDKIDPFDEDLGAYMFIDRSLMVSIRDRHQGSLEWKDTYVKPFDNRVYGFILAQDQYLSPDDIDFLKPEELMTPPHYTPVRDPYSELIVVNAHGEYDELLKQAKRHFPLVEFQQYSYHQLQTTRDWKDSQVIEFVLKFGNFLDRLRENFRYPTPTYRE